MMQQTHQNGQRSHHQCTSDRLPEVIQCPTRNDQVDGQNQKTGDKTQESHITPTFVFGAQSLISQHRSMTCTAADDQFAQQECHTDKENKKQVENDGGTATILATNVRKTPDVAQSDSRACSSHDGTERGRETVFVICHSNHICKNAETRRSASPQIDTQ